MNQPPNIHEIVAEQLLSSPLPTFEGADAFEHYVRDVDLCIEHVGEERATALGGLRLAAGEEIGKRLSGRRREFFTHGRLIGTEGYTAETHYLVGDGFFFKKPNSAEAREELAARISESPDTFAMVGIVLQTALAKKILGRDQTLYVEGMLNEFDEIQLSKTADEQATWLVEYLKSEKRINHRAEEGNSPLSFYDINEENSLLNSLYQCIVNSTSLGASVESASDEDTTLDQIYEIVISLERLSYKNRDLKQSIMNLVADIARQSLMHRGLPIVFAIELTDEIAAELGPETTAEKLAAIASKDSQEGRVTRMREIDLSTLLPFKAFRLPHDKGRENAQWN